jgi:CheY-like chemotaxis protein
MMRRSNAEKRGLAPLATIVAHATQSQEPAWFTTAPVGAMRKPLERTGWTAKGVDLYEVNEAFAVDASVLVPRNVTGIPAGTTMHASTQELCVVALSASAMEDEVRVAKEAGALDYWTKPVDVLAFRDGMRNLLQVRRT